MKIIENLIFTSGLLAERTITQTNLSKEEMDVARATPAIPSFGSPSHPKINDALSKMLSTLAATLTTVLALTLETDLRVLKYTSTTVFKR